MFIIIVTVNVVHTGRKLIPEKKEIIHLKYTGLTQAV
jgi:hypothetical protein